MAVGGVIGDDRAFKLRVCFFERLDLVFFHVDSAENEIDLLCDLLRIRLGIHNDHGFDAFGDRLRHVPFIADRLRVGLACAVRAGCQHDRREPRMICCQQNEPLPDHTRCTNDTDSEFFHDESSNPQTHRKVPVACHFGMYYNTFDLYKK